MVEPITASPLKERSAGILLHPTSLPGHWPNGDLGPDAYRFVDWLEAAGQRIWQILPIGPTHGDGSPYQSLSVHAGNPELISIEKLVEYGLLDVGEIGKRDIEAKRALVHRAHSRFGERADAFSRDDLARFVAEQAGWLEDYALFRAIRLDQGERGWTDWPAPLRDRDPKALAAFARERPDLIELVRFEQYVFFRQWRDLKAYANDKRIGIFGDMPIFVAHDSADVWARRDQFLLDPEGHPTVVAGVPPDYFSETGQRWGNPHYDWAHMQADGFSWWIERMEAQLALFDLVRIDHFRGFQAYWEVPAHKETAIDGRWVEAPGDALLQRLHERFDPLPVVAEDLGTITAEVTALRDKYALPGMKILQFAFDSGPDNPYLPHNHAENSVVYTGTHDNDTTVGWYGGLDERVAKRMGDYLGLPGEPMPWPLIRACYASVSRLAVIPMQDALVLDSRHRMNTPGTNSNDNWRWRFTWGIVPEELAGKLHGLVHDYGRLPG